MCKSDSVAGTITAGVFVGFCLALHSYLIVVVARLYDNINYENGDVNFDMVCVSLAFLNKLANALVFIWCGCV